MGDFWSVVLILALIEAGLRGRENPGLQAGDESYPLK